MNHLLSQNNKKLLENLIPEKGSAFEYEKEMSFTDPFDIAFDHPFECSLPHLLNQEQDENTNLFI